MVSKRNIDSFEETSRIAQALAELLQGGDFVALNGDLGAGKTSFTRELTKFLGCRKLANSPSYSLFQRYRGGKLEVLHGDLYRLASMEELDDLGWDERLQDFSQGLVVIEWADKFLEALPEERLQLTWFHGEQEEDRILEIFGVGARGAELAQALSKESCHE